MFWGVTLHRPLCVMTQKKLSSTNSLIMYDSQDLFLTHLTILSQTISAVVVLVTL